MPDVIQSFLEAMVPTLDAKKYIVADERRSRTMVQYLIKIGHRVEKHHIDFALQHGAIGMFAALQQTWIADNCYPC